MFDHVALLVSDLDRSRKFYEQTLEPLGARVVMEFPGVVLFAVEEGGPMLGVRQAEQELSPQHVAFRAGRETVNKFYEAALAAGGRDNSPPGVRAHYHENYYAAYVHDPDGHNIEAVCHTPA